MGEKKYKPILFSTEMVKAILDGRKTMTRRIITKYDYLDGYASVKIIRDPVVANEKFEEKSLKGLCAEFDGGEYIVKCKWDIAGTLWVKETFAHQEIEGYFYKADEAVDVRWTPSLFMPRKAARLFLEITSIKVERLQDISDHDARCEGNDMLTSEFGSDSISWFKNIWQNINGKGSWDSNPWCWCVSFQRLNDK